MKKRSGEHSKLMKSEKKLAYLLLTPTFLILTVIAFYPLASVFVTSMTDRVFASSEGHGFVGLQNYKELLGLTVKELPQQVDEETGEERYDKETGRPVYERAIRILPRTPIRYKEVSQFSLFGKRYVIGATDRNFIRAVVDTLGFTVTSVVLETILGMMVALILNTNFKGRGVMRAVMLVPWAIPTAVSSRIWEWMFSSSRIGFFNVIFQKLGWSDGQFAFITNSSSQLWAMVSIDVWKTTPFMALLILAGLQMIPGDMYEAARVDGAGRIRQFFSLTLPFLRPILAVALIFRTLDALRVFDLFQIVLAQKRYSMASFTYYQLIDNQAMGYSSASSVIIFLIILIFTVFYIKLAGGVENEK
jgi:trehalose/maltose transport system permease protein